MGTRNSKSKKQTVFLSHSSTNRRELLGLKRLLDERSGKLIDFFLSSDSESIEHGSVWPTAVKAALDRMDVMLVFVSQEALKSGWTYFEAGYGLRKLGVAPIYCLPGTDKASLPPPCNLLQNRNFHSASDVRDLIVGLNDALGAQINSAVSNEEFNRIFRKPMLGQVRGGPDLERIVSEIQLTGTGSWNSMKVFSEVCREKGMPDSEHESGTVRCSTGLRLFVEPPTMASESRLIDTSDLGEDPKEWSFEAAELSRNSYHFRIDDGVSSLLKEIIKDKSWGTLEEANLYNVAAQKRNEELPRINEQRRTAPRHFTFSVSPRNTGIPIGIIDEWAKRVGTIEDLSAHVDFCREIRFEERIQEISAKIHDSPFSLGNGGVLIWKQRVAAELSQDRWSEKKELKIKACDQHSLLPGEFEIEDMILTMFELQLIDLIGFKRSKRK